MPSRGLPSSHSSHHPTASYFAPSSSSSNDRTRIVDFSQLHEDDQEDEPGSRFDSPDSTPSTPSFSFTSSPPSEHYTIFPPGSSSPTHSASTLPTILPIPFPSISPKLSKLNTISPPPAYTSKFPAGLRVDASPTSPQRSLPPSNPIHAFLLRTIPHSILPESIKNSAQSSLPYPKSPSLLRPHPTTRHPLSSSTNGRPPIVSRTWLPKRWIVVIVFSLFLLVGYASLPSYSSEGKDDMRLGGWEKAWEKAKLRTGWDRGNQTSEMGENGESSGRLNQARKGEERIRIESLKVEEEIDTKRGNHHSNPSPDHEAEEEQAALNFVVEQAKAAAASQALEDAHASASKETLQRVVKEKHSNNLKPFPVAKPPKDPSRYKRLLPLNAPSRRYLYGANFIPSAADHEGVLVEDPEYSNKKVKVPSKKTLERLFKENKATYEKEEEGWREFEWKAPEVDKSLTEFIERLSPEELSLRSWIRELHALPTASGVGLGASPLSPFPPPSLSTSLSPLSSTPALTRGNEGKYAELMMQAKEGFEGKCAGSNWLDSYKTMHNEMLEGKRDPKFISYHCEKGMNCGGLGDRLLGMTSAFFFGLITQRSFLGEWQSPIPLDVVFDSPSVNWSYSSFTSSRHPVLGQQSRIEQSAELDIIHFDRLSVDSTFGSSSWNPKKGKKWTKGFEKRDIAYASNWIKFFTNRGMIYRSFAYKHLQKSVNRLGLEPSTAFACINQYLFRPKPPALNLISEYTSVLALPSVFSVGIHVRTGDRSMKDSEYDKINTVKRHSQFFRCARELGETYSSPSQQVVYYLVTDSAHLKSDARSVLGSKLVTTDMVPQHVHQKSGHVDGVFSAVVEDWILAKTDMMVATQDSGFGKLASFMHAKENTTVTIFPRFNEDVNGLQSKKSHLKVDCTDPNVFTTFEELSSEWSLG